ncbi:MAG: hypothetical protein R3B81_16100 [bacterium]
MVDLRQAYAVAGEALAGSFEMDYRILVHGPCENPPVLGKYDEEWIAHGTFVGTVDGVAASGTLIYTAQVRAGGDVDGRMSLTGDVAGELAVSGNFGDGRLSYSGELDSLR